MHKPAVETAAVALTQALVILSIDQLNLESFVSENNPMSLLA